MPTPIFVCGAECGIGAAGTASAGVEHWTGSGPTVVTSGPATMRSTRCFRTNGAAFLGVNNSHVLGTAVASPATAVARFYVYFATLPTSSVFLFAFTGTSAGTPSVVFNSADSKLYAGNALATIGATGVAVTTGQWYRVDVKAVLGTTRTVDVQVDGIACGQFTVAGQTATTCTGFTFGAWTGAGTFTCDLYHDDIILSGTSADFPIGAGTVVGLYPNGDKTNSAATPTDGNGGHLYPLTSNFGKGSAGGTAVGLQNAESTSWQSLANPLSTSIATNFISDKTGTNTNRLAWTHDATPATVSTVNGVMLVAATHSATATANNQGMQLTDSTGANVLTAWSALDLSESTITVPVVTFATKPGGGAWDKASVDGSLIRWGLSSDVSPVPSLDGICLEVDYVPATGLALPFPAARIRPNMMR